MPREHRWIPSRFQPIVLLVLVISLVCAPLGAAARSGLAEVESFRTELYEFFANLHQYAPNTFGNLRDSSEALAAVREEIYRLTPGQLSAMREVFDQVPAWELVPAMLSASLPEEVRDAIDQVADLTADHFEGLEQFRSELNRVSSVLALLPADTLSRLGHTPEKVRRAQQIHAHADPQLLAATRGRLEQRPGWKAIVQLLNSPLSPQMEEVVSTLAAQGGLSAEDRAELEIFRDELTGFFAGLQLLSSEISEELDYSTIDDAIARLQTLEPEMLYLVRHRITNHDQWRVLPEILHQGLTESDRKNLQLLVQAGPLTDERRSELEQFREEMDHFYNRMQSLEMELDSLAEAQQQLRRFNSAQLTIAQGKLEQTPGWQALPDFMVISQRLSQVQPISFKGSPFQVPTLELELFRSQIESAITQLQDEGQMSSPQLKHGSTRPGFDISAGTLLRNLPSNGARSGPGNADFISLDYCQS